VRVGGSFHLQPASLAGAPSLFIAGGIGITALAAMVGHLVQASAATPGGAGGRAQLIYSARAPHEFALLPRLLAWQQQSAGRLTLQLHTTQAHGMPPALQQHQAAALPPGVSLLQRRLLRADVEQALQELAGGSGRPGGGAGAQQPAGGASNASGSGRPDGEAGAGATQGQGVQAYVCGPPGMTDAMVEQLHALGLEEGRVHSEKWW